MNNNPHFIAMCRLTRQLDKLIAEGNDEGNEGEAIRDQMDFHWYRLKPEEIEELNQLFSGETKDEKGE